MPAPKDKTERLAAYSDGILAVVATLLVLGIAVPSDHEFESEGFLTFLAKLQHDIGAYTLSFLIISSYWIQHHVIFSFLERATRRFIWLNCGFLFFVTLIPFVTKLVSHYRHDAPVVLLYGLVQVVCGGFLVVLWNEAYAQRSASVVDLDPQVKRSMTLRILAGPTIDLLGVAAAPFSVPVALVCFLVAPLLNLSHRRVDHTLQVLFDQ